MKRLYCDLILIISLFVCAHLILLPQMCSNLPYSIYYQPKSGSSKVVPKKYTEISKMKNKTFSEDLIIVVLTSSKRKESYLHQTLSSLHLEQSKATGSFHLIVCSADSVKASFEENLNFTWILPCLDGKCDNSMNKRGNKHIEDFLLCHEAVRSKYNPQYELWLEDDVTLMEDFFSTFKSIMAFRKAILSSTAWLDVKLYKTPRLRGYAWDLQPLTELISMALLFSVVINQILYILWSSKKASARILTLFICILITLKAISRYLDLFCLTIFKLNF